MPELIVVLDNLRSAHNTGALMRTGDGVKVKQLVLAGITPLPDHPQVRKTALIDPKQTNWIHVCLMKPYLEKLKMNKFKIYGLETGPEAKSIFNVNFQPRSVLVLGNEVSGLSLETRSVCDLMVRIPQRGVKHSLNVAIAGSVAMYEFERQMRL